MGETKHQDTEWIRDAINCYKKKVMQLTSTEKKNSEILGMHKRR